MLTAAFLLNERDPKGLSVFRTDSLGPQDIVQLAKQQLRVRKMFGRGDIQTIHIYANNLDASTSIFAHRLHVNITGWPSKEHERLLIAGRLAQKAEYRHEPSWSHSPT